MSAYPAIKAVLASYRSSGGHVTEAQVQAAWAEFDALSSRETELSRRLQIAMDTLTVLADRDCDQRRVSRLPEGRLCSKRWPEDPERWCFSCIASAALFHLTNAGLAE